MRTVGERRERGLSPMANGELLAEGARFCETMAHLALTTFIPKGVYRFKSHQLANQHEQECLARGMARVDAELG